MPVGGALDLASHRIANLLVGNDAAAATLEVTLAGPELRMEQDARVAVTGADLQAEHRWNRDAAWSRDELPPRKRASIR